jgi:1-deoxy-D-xylulose-5-phosphate synthase
MELKYLSNIKETSDLRRLPLEALPQVAQEMRDVILTTVSQKGGHLGAGLGATDITLALHYVFETPRDIIIWDTGHQAYGHKLLTGRQDHFHTIRQYGGLSGFLRRDESPYDAFGAGHASTAISAAAGYARSRDHLNQSHRVVAVVSDGCMTGGMSFEGMRNSGQLGTDVLVILNDNQMFISHRVGAFGAFLTKLLASGVVTRAEEKVEKFLKRFHFWGPGLVRVAKRIKVILFPGMLFEEMGFVYFGPVDGHDVVKLAQTLRHLRQLKGPVLLHVITKKGKGIPYAEAKPIVYHGPGKFDKVTGQMLAIPPSAPAYTKVFSQTLVRLAREDSKVVAITAAMPEGTGLDAFRDALPDRYFDVGLAEQHAVTFAAGLACQGLKPVTAIYVTFLQRAFDQLILDIGLQNLPVVFCLDRAGLVGEDGPTHHGVLDFAYLRMIPNFIVMAPKDENELQHMLYTALQCNGPVALRYPRGSGLGVPLDPTFRRLEIGKGEILKEGRDAFILAIGKPVAFALEAAAKLAESGLSVGVANMRFVKPLDTTLIESILKKTSRLITVEDHNITGGFGSAVMEAVAPHRAEVWRIGVPDRFVEHGSQSELYREVGLDAGSIADKIRQVLGSRVPV